MNDARNETSWILSINGSLDLNFRHDLFGRRSNRTQSTAIAEAFVSANSTVSAHLVVQFGSPLQTFEAFFGFGKTVILD
jgi:hypothetical protein